jgi:hypothetical protein
VQELGSSIVHQPDGIKVLFLSRLIDINHARDQFFFFPFGAAVPRQQHKEPIEH